MPELNIQYDHYEKCKLPHKPFFVKKYFISKGEKANFESRSRTFKENAIIYIAVLNKDSINNNDPPENIISGNYIAYKICAEGKDPKTYKFSIVIQIPSS